ncbi:hypothetical protein PD716_07095 [Vibrio gigantis]|uniref:hypothetical protein n=1 Tax=Vibrio gigantis TaxID=296199 RepID=UPI0039F1F997
MGSIRAILNGKSQDTRVKASHLSARDNDIDLQVRVFWESSDMFRLVSEANCPWLIKNQ